MLQIFEGNSIGMRFVIDCNFNAGSNQCELPFTTKTSVGSHKNKSECG